MVWSATGLRMACALEARSVRSRGRAAANVRISPAPTPRLQRTLVLHASFSEGIDLMPTQSQAFYGRDTTNAIRCRSQRGLPRRSRKLTKAARMRLRLCSTLKDIFIYIYIYSLWGLSGFDPPLKAPHSLSRKPGRISAGQSREEEGRGGRRTMRKL